MMTPADVVPGVSAGCLVLGIWIGRCWPPQNHVTNCIDRFPYARINTGGPLLCVQGAGTRCAPDHTMPSIVSTHRCASCDLRKVTYALPLAPPFACAMPVGMLLFTDTWSYQAQRRQLTQSVSKQSVSSVAHVVVGRRPGSICGSPLNLVGSFSTRLRGVSVIAPPNSCLPAALVSHRWIPDHNCTSTSTGPDRKALCTLRESASFPI